MVGRLTSWTNAWDKFRSGTAAALARARDRSDLLRMELSLTPVERHLAHAALSNPHGLFHRSYDDWRTRRIDKLLELYGIDYFIGRNILEVGCGHAEIGAFFADLGAHVVAVDGRTKTINYARLRHRNEPRLQLEQADLDGDFGMLGSFDLIINFGLLYHLRDVEAHLRRCFSMADDVVVETVVCDSTDPDLILLREENAASEEDALGGTGSRPSPFYVERLAIESGFGVERIFSTDLNSGAQFRYDWQHRNDGSANDDLVNRRFWRFRRTPGSPGPSAA